MPANYPIFLDLAGRTVVIVGGGAVAERKAAGVLEAGAAHVKVVAVSITARFAGNVERIVKPYDSKDLCGASLVFAATNSNVVNDAVVADARVQNIWVNRADPGESTPGDFITPAKIVSGPIVVAVSAGSAALTALVRKGLSLRFDPAWATMAEAMATLRPIIRDQLNLPPEARRDVFRDLATDEAIRVLVDEQFAGLVTWLNRRHPTLGLK